MTDTLPLFPLSSVLLPRTTLPLHIFEPRYRQLVSDLVGEVIPDRRFGVVGIKQGWEVGDDNVDAMYDIGCSALVEQVQQLPEGRYDLTVTGDQRFRLLQIDDASAPYLMAHVEWLPDEDADFGEYDHLATTARAAHEQYHTTGLRGDRYDPPDPEVDFADLGYALLDNCVLTTEDRQAVLAETHPVTRLRSVRALLLRETEFLRELRAVPAPLTEFAEQSSVN